MFATAGTFKKPTSKILAETPVYFLAILPLIAVCWWHFVNHGYPSGDGGFYVSQGQNVLEFVRSQGVWGACKEALFFTKNSWSPTLLGPLLFPFLAFFHGKILVSTAALLLLSTTLLAVYCYKNLRLTLAPKEAALGTSCLLSTSWIFYFSTHFLTEIVMLAWIAAAVFHLLKSSWLTQRRHAVAAGIFMGLAFCLRPAEITMAAFFPLIVLLALGKAKGFWIRKEILTWIASLVCILLGIVLKIFFHIGSGWIFPTYGFSILMPAIVLKKYHRLLVVPKWTFSFLFTGILFFWWYPKAPALYNWIHATSFGLASVLYPAGGHLGFFQGIAKLFIEFFNWPYLFFFLILLVGLRRSHTEWRDWTYLGLALASMVPHFFIQSFSTSSDLRHLLISVLLIHFAVFRILLSRGFSLRRLAKVSIAGCFSVQIIMILSYTSGRFLTEEVNAKFHLLNSYWRYASVPLRSEDPSLTMVKRLEEDGFKDAHINVLLVGYLLDPYRMQIITTERNLPKLKLDHPPYAFRSVLDAFKFIEENDDYVLLTWPANYHFNKSVFEKSNLFDQLPMALFKILETDKPQTLGLKNIARTYEIHSLNGGPNDIQKIYLFPIDHGFFSTLPRFTIPTRAYKL